MSDFTQTCPACGRISPAGLYDINDDFGKQNNCGCKFRGEDKQVTNLRAQLAAAEAVTNELEKEDYQKYLSVVGPLNKKIFELQIESNSQKARIIKWGADCRSMQLRAEEAEKEIETYREKLSEVIAERDASRSASNANSNSAQRYKKRSEELETKLKSYNEDFEYVCKQYAEWRDLTISEFESKLEKSKVTQDSYLNQRDICIEHIIEVSENLSEAMGIVKMIAEYDDLDGMSLDEIMCKAKDLMKRLGYE